MKIKSHAVFGCILALGAVPLAAQSGIVESAGCGVITGWAYDGSQPNTPISVDLYDQLVPIATVVAGNYRSDLYAAGFGNGYHGFSFATPPSLKDGKLHIVVGYFAGTKITLSYTQSFTCPAGTTGYVYYYNDPLTSINPSNWIQNGSVTPTSTGLTVPSTNEGSLISSVAVPDGSSDYEVKTTLTIPSNGGTYASYLRASNNAQTGVGTTESFYALAMTPAVSSSGCSLTLTVYKAMGGSVTQVLSFGVPCHNGTTVRFAIRGSILTITTDNQLWWAITDTSISTGKPGIGALGTPAGNSISAVSIGPADRVAPQAPDPNTFATSVVPNRMDFKMAGIPDDPMGLGIGYYVLLRSDGWVSGSHQAEFTDETVLPSTTYSYSVYAVDYHYNLSPTKTFTITTPPAGSVDPRRVGLRPTGTYWGGSGEQIDVLSGNLNFTLPLLNAQGRGGWKVPFALNYNSQNWRQDANTTWNLGSDVGYGYGWKLLAGSLTPFYTGFWGVDHYVFTDSTGAEYRLGQNTNGVWSSSESIYVWYDSNANVLHFRDGSFWIMGCTSSGSEPDAGTMYPTTMEDSNGNQILVYYFAGAGLPYTNSSARIQYIQDVRAFTSGSVSVTYTFLYSTDLIPHLTSIQNHIGTSEGYLFTFSPTQSLTSPFSSTTFGSMTNLSSVGVIGVNLLYNLAYDSSGEMTKATFPYGGYLKWAYGNVAYSSGFTQREVQTRTMSKDGTVASELVYPFTHESPTTSHPTHQFTSLADPGGIGQKYWTFSPSGSNIGLVTRYQGQQLPGPTTLAQNDFTWTQDASGNFYIGTTQNTYNPGSNQAVSQTNQTVDVYGNVTQVKKFNFGNLQTPARTYNYSYLNSSNYTARYIYNRLVSGTVTDGTNTVPLASNVYDYTNFPQLNGSPQEWDYSYAQVSYRGDLTSSTTPDGTRNINYDLMGNPTSVIANGVGVALTPSSTNNFAAPTQLSTGSLTNTLTWSSFLGLTNDTGPNGESSGTTYDSYARQTQTTSPFGAMTNYTYNTGPYTSTNPATVTATTNGRWTRTTLDGFGRTVKTETGDASSTKSVAESVYGPCACSPLGKLTQQAMPHAVGATPTWTTYSYDGIGRTLSTATVGTDTQGTTTYIYGSNSTSTYVIFVDAASKWKYYYMDGLNHLAVVGEPATAADPSGPLTWYTYDLLDHLASVYMQRTAGTQTRTFVYSGNNLMSATNPENGTVTYTYNGLNKVATRSDARGLQKQYTYDGLGRLSQVQRFYTQNGQLVSAGACGTDTYSYDSNPLDSTYSQYTLGRLAAVQYGCSFAEMYSYNQAGAKTAKRLRVTRQNLEWDNYPGFTAGTGYGDLNSTYSYDSEGKMIGLQYPSGGGQTGLTVSYGYDTMGRLNTMTDTTSQINYVTGTTYNPANQLLSITGGNYNETRTYNSMQQLTQLIESGSQTLNISYGYPGTGNNGKLASQTDNLSGEQVVYTYDALNRLASAAATNNSWGQSYTYDGFGNLTAQTVTAGSAPSYQVTVDGATNHLGGEDANGNAGGGNCTYAYNYENLLGSPNCQGLFPTWVYAYDPGNRRVYRGVNPDQNGNYATDEVTFWSVTGKRLASYQISVIPGNGPQNPPRLQFTATQARLYFGGRLLGGDIRGSFGKFYPYGQEKPSATQNGTEKFTGYLRDSETGMDYAVNRFHNPGTGRFLTADPYMASGGLADPGSWNRYAYTRGDPVNRVDRHGLVDGPPSLECGPWGDCSGGGDDGGWCSDGGMFDPGLMVTDCGDSGYDPAPEPSPAPAPPPAKPSCLDYFAQSHIDFVQSHVVEGGLLSFDTGYALNGAKILGWAAMESGWGTNTWSQRDNNFFSYALGRQYSSFYDNGKTAIFSTANYFQYNGKIGVSSLTILSDQFANGASVSQAFSALAAAGYDRTDSATYGDAVVNRWLEVTAIEDCLAILGGR